MANQPNDASPVAPSGVRWTVLTLSCLVSWLLYVHRYSWGLVKTSFKDENPHLTDTQRGWIDASFGAAYAIAQVPGGYLGDRFGARWVLSAMIFGWSLAFVWVSQAPGALAVSMALAAFGLAQAGAYPVLSRVSRNWFPFSIRTSAQGVIASSGRIGAASAALLLAFLLIGTLHIHWRDALLILSIPGFLLAIAFCVYFRNSPSEHPQVNEAERTLIGGGVSTPADRPRLLLNRGSTLSLGMLLLYAFCSTFQDQLYVFWVPEFLEKAYDLSKQEVGVLTPLPLIGGAIGGMVGGWLNDRLIRKWSNRRWARACVGLVGKLIAAGLVFLCVLMGVAWLAMVVLLTARLFGDWGMATQWGATTDMAGRASATVFGLVNTAGAIGGFLANPVLGNLKEHHGWIGLFAGVAIMNVAAGLCWLLIDCTKKVVSD